MEVGDSFEIALLAQFLSFSSLVDGKSFNELRNKWTYEWNMVWSVWEHIRRVVSYIPWALSSSVTSKLKVVKGTSAGNLNNGVVNNKEL